MINADAVHISALNPLRYMYEKRVDKAHWSKLISAEERGCTMRRKNSLYFEKANETCCCRAYHCEYKKFRATVHLQQEKRSKKAGEM